MKYGTHKTFFEMLRAIYMNSLLGIDMD